MSLLVLAHPGSPGQRAAKQLCVFVVIKYQYFLRTNVQFQDFSGPDFSGSENQYVSRPVGTL